VLEGVARERRDGEISRFEGVPLGAA
jgi:hypothetical protein